MLLRPPIAPPLPGPFGPGLLTLGWAERASRAGVIQSVGTATLDTPCGRYIIYRMELLSSAMQIEGESMPIMDIEWVFRCSNPTEIGDCTKGICKGMVMMFIRAVAGMVDDRNWFADLHTGRFLDPDRRAGFYMTAATLQIAGQNRASELRATIPDPDANELRLVPEMYRRDGLEAVALSGGYVDPQRGRALADGVRDPRYEWFHVSLRSASGGHSIAIWRSSAETFLLFDPNFGAVQFIAFERFRAILDAEFTPEHGDGGAGLYDEYRRVCWWGIEISADDLPPPPPPPH
jgi:virulence surface antigen